MCPVAEDLRLGLIVNPRAFKVRTRYLQNGRFWANRLPEELVWIPDGIDALERDLNKARDAGINHLAILGGDGTVHMTLSKLLPIWSDTLPTIVPLRGGTINALCSDLGISASAEAAFSDVLRMSRGRGTRRLTEKRLIRVTDSNGSDRYGFSFANGGLYRGFCDYYRTSVPDAMDAVRATLNVILSAFMPIDSRRNLLRPIHARATSREEELVDGGVRLVVISTLENLVLWFRPFPDELNGRPAFHCMVNRMEPLKIAFNAWSLMRGGFRHPDHILTETDEMLLETEDGYLLDGDMFHIRGPVDIRITIGPAVRFLTAMAR